MPSFPFLSRHVSARRICFMISCPVFWGMGAGLVPHTQSWQIFLSFVRRNGVLGQYSHSSRCFVVILAVAPLLGWHVCCFRVSDRRARLCRHFFNPLSLPLWSQRPTAGCQAPTVSAPLGKRLGQSRLSMWGVTMKAVMLKCPVVLWDVGTGGDEKTSSGAKRAQDTTYGIDGGCL